MSARYFQAPSNKSDRLHRHGCNWSNSRVTICFISCNIFKESHKYFLSGTENDGTPCGGAAYWLYAGGIIILVAVSKFRIKTRRSSSRHHIASAGHPRHPVQGARYGRREHFPRRRLLHLHLVALYWPHELGRNWCLHMGEAKSF